MTHRLIDASTVRCALTSLSMNLIHAYRHSCIHAYMHKYINMRTSLTHLFSHSLQISRANDDSCHVWMTYFKYTNQTFHNHHLDMDTIVHTNPMVKNITQIIFITTKWTEDSSSCFCAAQLFQWSWNEMLTRFLWSHIQRDDISRCYICHSISLCWAFDHWTHFVFDAVTWLPLRLHSIWTSSSFRHTVCFYMVSLRVCVSVCVFADRSIYRSIDLDIVIHLIKWIQFIYKISNGHMLVYALWRVTYTRDWLGGAHKDCTSDVWPKRLVLWPVKKKNPPIFVHESIR